MSYTPRFEREYENGWMAFPSEETLITAHALNEYDETFEHIEEYLENNDPNENIAAAYNDTATYAVGDYVMYEGVLYKCITAVEEAEDFDSEKWTEVIVTDELGSGGTNVIANPVGTPTDDLETIQIGNTIYDIPGGGGGNANIWTGTQAELEEVFDDLKEGTQINITNDEEHIQAFDVYSTDERVVGQWIDGKTLYRRVFDLGADISVPNNAFTNTTIDASTMATLVNARAIFSTGVTVYQVMANINNGIIRLQADRNDNQISVRYVILEYTKTTD